MFSKKSALILTLSIIFLLAVASVAQAAPPVDDGSSLGESLELGEGDGPDGNLEEEETGSKNNLGAIMSGKGDPDGTTTPTDPDDPNNQVKNHPVGSAISDYFEVPYEEIMELHQAGNGFGAITKAYFFAEKIEGMDPSDLLDAARGSGWGNLLKDNGIHPGAVGNGGKHADKFGQPPDDDGTGNLNGPPGQIKRGNGNMPNLVGQGNNGNSQGNAGGNSNGNGNGNGVSGRPDNNGNGHGNCNAGCNDNGHGNAGGNGNSNGHGKNKNK